MERRWPKRFQFAKPSEETTSGYLQSGGSLQDQKNQMNAKSLILHLPILGTHSVRGFAGTVLIYCVTAVVYVYLKTVKTENKIYN